MNLSSLNSKKTKKIYLLLMEVPSFFVHENVHIYSRLKSVYECVSDLLGILFIYKNSCIKRFVQQSNFCLLCKFIF